MAHIIFLVQVAFTPRDHARYGIELIAGRGIAVTVLDVGPIAVPELAERPAETPGFPGMELRVVKDREALETELPTLKSASVIVCQVGSGFVDPRNLPILRLVARSGIPFLVLNASAVPYWTEPASARWATSLLPRLKRFDPLKSLLNRLPPAWLGLRAADFVVCGGRKSRHRRPLITGTTREILAHSMDYDVLRVNVARASAPPARPFAVFIDQGFGFHPDAVALKDDTFDPRVLYPLLNALFDSVERELGLEVIVAGHPRIDYGRLGPLFGDREVVTGRTVELIASCSLTIAISSTALGIAIQCGKPAMVVATRQILAHPIGPMVKRMAEMIGRRVVALESPGPLEGALDVDAERYARYVEDFVKEPGTPEAPLWQIVLDELAQAGVLPNEIPSRQAS